ncbi:hypothetical protein [uncultured Nitratireductor sp.]|uniref:hypothetical protein n=1 Tax=uncultured Nitratireductor sp. TaxID=520953 RepID=UPI0025D8FB9B|nr:hypothetical protein [uncultured Nitratireductor sp.]
MKIRSQGRFFRATGLIVPTAVLLLTLAGCVSASLEDAAPSAAVSTPTSRPAPVSEVANAPGVRNTGAYPDLNIPPESAAIPIDATEKDTLTRDLSAARERLAGSVPSSNADAEALRLRRLAKTHASRQLEEIEKSE